MPLYFSYNELTLNKEKVMKTGEYYAEDPKVMQVVRLGQELITACENGELFPGNDDESYELWNAAVTAGNRMTTYGMVWSSFKSVNQLNKIQKKAVLTYLDSKKK
jgi:hypothetical protein